MPLFEHHGLYRMSVQAHIQQGRDVAGGEIHGVWQCRITVDRVTPAAALTVEI